MSHAARNWAFKLENVPPGPKLVLLHLADFHREEGGCFPSQARLAQLCAISRASLNRYLAALEGLGLIRRESGGFGPDGEPRSTRYHLIGMTETFPARAEPGPVAPAAAAAKAASVVPIKRKWGRSLACKITSKSVIRSAPLSQSETGAVSQAEGEHCLNTVSQSLSQPCDTNLPSDPVNLSLRSQPVKKFDRVEFVEAQKRRAILDWIEGRACPGAAVFTPERLAALVASGSLAQDVARSILRQVGSAA